MTMTRTATLLVYGEDSTPDSWGDVVTFAPASLYVDDDAVPALLVQHVTVNHAAGYASSTWTEGDRVRARFTTLDTPAGLALEQEWAAGLRDDVSVGVYIDEYTVEPLDPDDADDPWAPMRMTVQLGDLVEGSACFRGRFPSAKFDPLDTVEGSPSEGIPA